MDKARTEQELKAAGDILAEAVVGLGIDVLFSVLGRLGSWFKGKGKGTGKTAKVDDNNAARSADDVIESVQDTAKNFKGTLKGQEIELPK